MTRVLSGAVLIVFAIAVVWFAPSSVFFVVAEGLLVIAFVEYGFKDERKAELERRIALALGAH